MPKHVCMVGRSPKSQHLARQNSFTEIWGVGVVYREFPVSRLARIYEIHPAWMLEQPAYDPTHWGWVQCQTQTEVICTDPAVRGTLYPVDEVLEMAGVVRRGEEPNKFLTSTLDFMLAHAVYEGVDEITLAGFDMTTETEYGYQVPGAAFWLGFAAGKGITIHLPEKSPLLKAALYAIEIGGQMIGRQKLETYKVSFQLQMEGAQAVFNVRLGREQALREAFQANPNDETRAAYAEAQEDAMDAERDLHVKSGAFQALVKMIKECDLEEPDMEIVPMFGKVKFRVEEKAQ